MCRPIDLPPIRISESVGHIRFGDVDIWMSFFNATPLMRPMAENDEDWGRLLKRDMGRMSTMGKRLSGIRETPNATWAIGDATVRRMDGVRWDLKEYFHPNPVDLLRGLHIDCDRYYQICGAELMTSAGIATFFGDTDTGRQVILHGTDNRNTFSRIGNRIAKRGFPSGSLPRAAFGVLDKTCRRIHSACEDCAISERIYSAWSERAIGQRCEEPCLKRAIEPWCWGGGCQTFVYKFLHCSVSVFMRPCLYCYDGLTHIQIEI